MFWQFLASDALKISLTPLKTKHSSSHKFNEGLMGELGAGYPKLRP
jgi:hypothetical protein